MQVTQQDPTLLDIFKERLSNPFMFTYFWAWCYFNWKAIAWLLMEPVKVSIKLQQFPNKFEWELLNPFLLALVMISLLPWVNSFVEVLKRWAENTTNRWLTKRGWKEMIEAEKHQKVEAQLRESVMHVERLEGRIETYKDNEDKINVNTEQLQSALTMAHSDKDALRSDNDRLREELGELSKRTEALQDEFARTTDQHRKEVNNYVTEVANMEGKIEAITDSLRKLKSEDISRFKGFVEKFKKNPSSAEFIEGVRAIEAIERNLEILAANAPPMEKEGKLISVSEATKRAGKPQIISGTSTGWRGRKN